MSGVLIPLFALLIPIVAILSKLVFQPWMRIKERQLELSSSVAAEKAAQYAAQTERLEQRVRVLERIVTDRGQDLAGEIERLRDVQTPYLSSTIKDQDPVR
jgi:ABC-type phosphate transport system auxiliary subunit